STPRGTPASSSWSSWPLRRAGASHEGDPHPPPQRQCGGAPARDGRVLRATRPRAPPAARHPRRRRPLAVRRRRTGAPGGRAGGLAPHPADRAPRLLRGGRSRRCHRRARPGRDPLPPRRPGGGRPDLGGGPGREHRRAPAGSRSWCARPGRLRPGRMTAGPRPVVIVGLPRSGTTWTLQALGTSPGVRRTFEPDNEEWHPAAIHGKHRLGRYPTLAPGEHDRAYHRLWEWILSGGYEGPRAKLALFLLEPGRRERNFEGKTDALTWLAGTVARDPKPSAPRRRAAGTGRVVAKSIHAQLALEWLSSTFDVEVLVLLRHPANVLASWLGMNLKDSRNATLETSARVHSRFVRRWGVPLPGPGRLEQMCWRIGLLTAALDEVLARHPEWHCRVHEELCTDPPRQFRSLFDELGLDWTPATAEYLDRHDQPGSGFTVERRASELPDAWQRRLDDDQLRTLRRV